jgi:hypothetical protein
MIPKCKFSHKLWDSADPDSTRSSCVPRPLAIPRRTDRRWKGESARKRERHRETVSHYSTDSMEFFEHFDWFSVGTRPGDLFTRYPMAKVMKTRTQGWTSRDPETISHEKFDCMESVKHFDWLSLGSRPRDEFTRYPLAKVIMTRTKSWTTRDPEIVFCFCPESGTHMFYRISIHLVKRRSTSFRTSVVNTLARSPGLEMQTRVLGDLDRRLNRTTLH